MSCANAGTALPENSASVSLVLIISIARPADPHELAGVEGFEPPNGGIKTRCLTTWRHPSTLCTAPRGGNLTAASSAPPLPQLLAQRRDVQPPCHRARPAVGNPRREALGLRGAGKRRVHARAGARQARRSEAAEPVERLAHLRAERAHDTLAVVPAARLKKVAYCDEGGISCQFRALEHRCGAHRDPRVNHQVPALGELDLGEALADTLPPRRKTFNKNRHIRSKGTPEHRELGLCESAPPELIQCQERRRGVRAPAP